MATGNLIDFDDAEPVAQSYPWTQPSGEALQAADSFDDLPPYQGPGYAMCRIFCGASETLIDCALPNLQSSAAAEAPWQTSQWRAKTASPKMQHLEQHLVARGVTPRNQ
jgi:hypothetical protein